MQQKTHQNCVHSQVKPTDTNKATPYNKDSNSMPSQNLQPRNSFANINKVPKHIPAHTKNVINTYNHGPVLVHLPHIWFLLGTALSVVCQYQPLRVLKVAHILDLNAIPFEQQEAMPALVT